MARATPFKRKLPDQVRRQLDLAAATAWQDLVEAHADHALRFVALLEHRLPFDDAIRRYLDEMDVRDPIASSIRSRVLIALEGEARRGPAPLARSGGDRVATESRGNGDAEGLKRFRPDLLVKGISRKVRESDEVEQLIALSIARAEEGIIGVHIDNAVKFSRIVRRHGSLHDAVEDYIDLMRITGGRAQSVFQRTMARLADLHLPDGAGLPGAGSAPLRGGRARG